MSKEVKKSPSGMPFLKRVGVHTAAALSGPVSMALVLLAATATVLFFTGWGAWLVVTYPLRRATRARGADSRAGAGGETTSRGLVEHERTEVGG